MTETSKQSIGLEKPLLNTLRWLSAFLVMGGHAFGWVLALDQPRFALFKYIIDLGFGGVVIFFVVSGYLVGGSVIRRADQFSWRDYSAARFARIYIVLIPALLLTCTLDGAVHLIAPNNPIYSHPWGRITDAVFSNYGLRNVAASVLSLESIIGRPLGSDDPLWSLGYEWFFYFLCPIAVIASSRWLRLNGVLRILAPILLCVPMLLFHMNMLALYWAIWFSGAAASQINAPRLVGLVGLVLGIAGLAIMPFANIKASIALEGLGFILLFAWPAAMQYRLNLKLDKILADLSYSLYVVHMPILTIIAFALWQEGLMPLSRFSSFGPGLAAWALMVTVCTGAAWLFSILFERRTDALKARLIGR